MFQDNGYELLGFFELGISYASLAVGCFMVEPVMRRTSVKFCLLAGCLADGLWIAAQIIPSYKNTHRYTAADSVIFSDQFIYFSNTIAALSSGLGSALLWVS